MKLVSGGKISTKNLKIGEIVFFFAVRIQKNYSDMEGNLVIVESPAKARNIQKFLGDDYVVKASFGHIRDLDEKKLGIDIEHGFKPEYIVPAAKNKVVSELKKAAAEAQCVWLASDEDREGEAISWHLCEALGLDPLRTKRIVFHEITKDALLKAVENPRCIDLNLVNAQQARRVLDRLVGFELSPVLWRKIQPKLSAGRVQSVALRLVVDREKEIMAYEPKTYYKVEAIFQSPSSGIKVKALLNRRFDDIGSARAFLTDCVSAAFTVSGVEEKEGTRFPAPPFTTSTLQQEAAHKLHLPVSATMKIAQDLYERGLITYMRTDSTNLSSLALGTAKKFILDNYGEQYLHSRQFKTKSVGAQEAHEAIRPTYIDNTAISGTPQEQKLYELIWKRTVASQMEDARLMNTAVTVDIDKREEKFEIRSSRIVFDGFLKVYSYSGDEEESPATLLPALSVGEALTHKGISVECKFTEAPARYSEGTLVKKLEELGIGRPSTYSPIISTLTGGRGYIAKGNKEGRKMEVENLALSSAGEISVKTKTETVGAEKGKLFPQEIGIIVTDYLVKNFPDILDYTFTANVEKDFDSIAEGKMQWDNVISAFYTPFHGKVDEALSDREYARVSREIGVAPDGDILIAKFGKYGPYVQKGDPEKKQFANLGKGQLIESITVDEALKLFELPRAVGEYLGIPVIATKGRFGPYIKYGTKNVSIPRSADPLKISLEECIALIEVESGKVGFNAVIQDFTASHIQILNGRYGPYIKYNGKNFKLPKGKNPASISESECKAIVGI